MNKKVSSVLWGVFLILCAGVLVASQLDLLGGLTVSVWKMLAVIFLIIIIIKSMLDRSFGGILFPIAIFCILFDEELGITALTPWTVLLVALLLTIALSMIFKDWRMKARCYHNVAWEHGKEHFDRIIDVADGEVVNSCASFGGTVKYVNTDNFKKAYIRNSFGASKIYFDKAVIQGHSAEIRLDCSFGGVELYIPREWRIINEASAAFGGIEEKNARAAGAADKDVYLTGSVSFAGVTIIYV